MTDNSRERITCKHLMQAQGVEGQAAQVVQTDIEMAERPESSDMSA